MVSVMHVLCVWLGGLILVGTKPVGDHMVCHTTCQLMTSTELRDVLMRDTRSQIEQKMSRGFNTQPTDQR